jgi:hypothetical protein
MARPPRPPPSPAGTARGLGSPRRPARRALPRLGARVAPAPARRSRCPLFWPAWPPGRRGWPRRGPPFPPSCPRPAWCGAHALASPAARPWRRPPTAHSCARCALCLALGVARRYSRSWRAGAARPRLWRGRPPARPRYLLAARQSGVCAALRARVLAWCARCLGTDVLSARRVVPRHVRGVPVYP